MKRNGKEENYREDINGGKIKKAETIRKKDKTVNGKGEKKENGEKKKRA